MKKDFSTGEVAKILNMGRSTVSLWIKQGRLNAHTTPGGKYRVTRENLVKLMNDNGIPLEYLEGYSKKRVLIVDDDPEITKLLKQAIKRKTVFNVKTASTCIQACMTINDYKPNVVVMDSGIEGINSKELDKVFKKKPVLQNTKLLCISGTTSKTEKELLKEGFNAFLPKPFDMDEFVQVVSDLVE